MIQIHRRYHRYVAVKNIHCVQPAAEPDFQNHHIGFGTPKNIHGGQGVELEISECGIAACGFDALERGGNGFIGSRLAVHADALVVAQNVRAGEHAGFEAGGAVDAFQKGAHRAFAVGAGHHDYGALRLQTHPFFHRAHALQAQINAAVAVGGAAGVGGFEVCEPLGECFHLFNLV